MLDHQTDELTENDHLTFLPGVGAHYEIMEGLGVLAGVYRGFSPVSPGQSGEVLPETSLNYEFGVRYSHPDTQTLLEAIGFYSDYSNLVGECTFSAGCGVDDLDKQFNAGEVDILGVEVVLSHTFALPAELRLPIRATYTYTRGEFKTSFVSSNPQFGDVQEGDQMPYVPAHQASLHVGIGGPLWDFDINTTYVDAMHEVAGGADAPAEEMTDSTVMLDATARYRPIQWLELYLKGENLLHSQPIVSRRPYGARPGKPLLVSGGLKLSW